SLRRLAVFTSFPLWGESRDGGSKQAAQRQSQSLRRLAVFTSFPLWGKAGMGVVNKPSRDKVSHYAAWRCLPPSPCGGRPGWGKQTSRPETKPVITALGGVYRLPLVGEGWDGGCKQTMQRQSQSLRRLVAFTSFPCGGRSGWG
ncbi:hypothetical protein HMPREF9080_00770, partial [Cardiobacterium valvarum F0432]